MAHKTHLLNILEKDVEKKGGREGRKEGSSEEEARKKMFYSLKKYLVNNYQCMNETF